MNGQVNEKCKDSFSVLRAGDALYLLSKSAVMEYKKNTSFIVIHFYHSLNRRLKAVEEKFLWIIFHWVMKAQGKNSCPFFSCCLFAEF